MPDPSLSEAIKEAYASAPADVAILHTIELRHPNFTEPVRVVLNYPDTETWLALKPVEVQAVLDALPDAEARSRVGLVARLEASAPANGGEYVAFVALAFDFELPAVESVAVPEIQLTVDNVDREISRQLELAVQGEDLVEVTYRPFLSTDIDGPDMDPPLTMTLSDVDVTPLRVTGRARLVNFGNKAFPSELYTAKRFPGLAR